ncbi:DUF6528 family protein [Nonomuraea sp. CA-143628]|uniref:DUF6528 family protein n=1 Tax=Nonomuraea sp. CA-143628 TaxID=3239997 RepID=UPI003D93C5B3
MTGGHAWQHDNKSRTAEGRRMMMRFVAVTALATAVLVVPGNVRATAAKPYGWVIMGDSKARQVVVMDSKYTTWNSTALKWKWKPSAKNGFPEADACGKCTGAISEVRLRNGGPGQVGGKSVVAVEDEGFIGVVSYPSGKRLWAINAGGADVMPHSAELLPGGNIAAVASKGGWLRVYTASQGPASKSYTEYPLPGGHGVLWDPARRLLWALGTHHLLSFEVGGTPAKPTLKEVSRTTLPGKHGGHDLWPVFSDQDRMWLTTNDTVFQYVKSTGTFVTMNEYSVRLVKAIGDQPTTGQILRTRPKSGCPATWCTDTVEFFNATDTRVLADAKIYKARWFTPGYQ